MKAVRNENERDLFPNCRQKSLLNGFEREGLIVACNKPKLVTQSTYVRELCPPGLWSSE